MRTLTLIQTASLGVVAPCPTFLEIEMTTKPEAIKRIEAAQYQVKGLREGQTYDYTTGESLNMSSIMDDAADAIEHLIAHIAAQDAEIARLIKVLTGYADSQYCKALEMFGRPECLGWEHKAATGKFTGVEYAAHKAANEAMGAHHGIYVALKRAALTTKGMV